MTPMQDGDTDTRVARIEQRLHDIRDVLEAFASSEKALARLEMQCENIKEDVRDGAKKFDALERRLEQDHVNAERHRAEARKERRAGLRWAVGMVIAACACIASIVAVIVSAVS